MERARVLAVIERLVWDEISHEPEPTAEWLTETVMIELRDLAYQAEIYQAPGPFIR